MDRWIFLGVWRVEKFEGGGGGKLQYGWQFEEEYWMYMGGGNVKYV